ncbi:MAG: hypothetical protein J1F66_02640 [Clostridiales bacterium]|nr:hypothetical protein [Clostridiales bacterium]
MKKLRIVLVGLLLLSTLFALFACQSNIGANRNRVVNSINHRGYGDAPENTLVAFHMSKDMGFDMVECDVRFTKDNEAVLLHDETVNRTSNGKGKIGNLTLSEVRELDFGSWKSDEYTGEKIPTFAEFIYLCVELELHPYVEVKSGVALEQAQYLTEIVDNVNIAVTWISRDKDVLTWLADLRTNDRFGLVTTFITKSDLIFLSELSKNVDVFIDTNYSFLTRRQINRCKSYGIPLEVWTVRSENRIKRLDSYITGVTSDYLNAQTIYNNL